MEATAATGPALVGLSLEGPRPVRRLTVAFRIILAIPHLLYLVLLSIVVVFAAIAAWVAALVLGRMPDGLGSFLGRFIQYSTRLYAYLYLLTDRYPPFSLEDGDYPVSVLLPPRGRLNRAAVLFRIILAIPAGIVVSVVSSGLQLSLILVWLIMLVSGRMPTPVFEAEASFLRYQARLSAWMLMLTSTYPSGLFGDGPSAAAPEAPDLEAPPDAPSSSLPPPPPAPAVAPRITRIVVSKAGKRLLVVFAALGILLTVGQIVVAIVTSDQSDRALRHLDDDYATVVGSSREYGLAVQGCAQSGGPACVQDANQDLADAVRRFREELVDEDFPEYALAAAADLRDDADRLIAILDSMARTSDPDAYGALVVQFQTFANEVDQDYLALRNLLRFGF